MKTRNSVLLAITLIVVTVLVAGCSGSAIPTCHVSGFLFWEETVLEGQENPTNADYVCGSDGKFHPAVKAPAPAAPCNTAAPAPKEAEAQPPAPTTEGEIQCHHVNGGIPAELKPGENANAGQVYVGDKAYEFVDDKVVVVTNNSEKPVKLNSTDGMGICTTSDYRLAVIVRFAQGCDSNGCSSVKWINVTNSGTDVKVVNEADFCKENAKEVFCK